MKSNETTQDVVVCPRCGRHRSRHVALPDSSAVWGYGEASHYGPVGTARVISAQLSVAGLQHTIHTKGQLAKILQEVKTDPWQLVPDN
jgi:hypothetical protein